MAYADQSISSRRVVAIVIVALLHAVIGYAFVTGLAYNVVKKVAQDLKTFDVEEEPPPPEELPPPPPPEQKVEPPPVLAPPPIVSIPTPAPPVVQTVREAPPVHITPTAPPAPPPPKPSVASPAKPRGNPANWITTDDYPSRALREEREGVTVVAFEITTEGRVENCRVTSSSGSPDLDEASCRNLVRRGRYTPAKAADGSAMTSSDTRRIRWQMPQN